MAVGTWYGRLKGLLACRVGSCCDVWTLYNLESTVCCFLLHKTHCLLIAPVYSVVRCVHCCLLGSLATSQFLIIWGRVLTESNCTTVHIAEVATSQFLIIWGRALIESNCMNVYITDNFSSLYFYFLNDPLQLSQTALDKVCCFLRRLKPSEAKSQKRNVDSQRYDWLVRGFSGRLDLMPSSSESGLMSASTSH